MYNYKKMIKKYIEPKMYWNNLLKKYFVLNNNRDLICYKKLKILNEYN